MGEANRNDSVKKEALADIKDSIGFIVIAIKEKEVKKHTFITNVAQAFIAVRELEQAKMGILFPPQASAAVVQ